MTGLSKQSIGIEKYQNVTNRLEPFHASEPEERAFERIIHIHNLSDPYAGVIAAINSFYVTSSDDRGAKLECNLKEQEQISCLNRPPMRYEHALEEVGEVGPEPSAHGPRLWALLIGNDRYPQCPLEGAVKDTLAWESYLTDFLGVPQTHITRIEDADRKTMVTAFYDLRDNAEIKEGDHILFAYSGHGSGYDDTIYPFEEDVIQQGDPIEALCPVDRGLSAPDIADREVLMVLGEIHERTKANITMFLDCSHYTGGVRSIDHTRRSRSLGPLIDPSLVKRMFVEADEHERRTSAISVRSPTWAIDTKDLYRPTVLAACHEDEPAREEGGNGLFTSTVLKVLRSENGRSVTCSGLIQATNALLRDQIARFDGDDEAFLNIDPA